MQMSVVVVIQFHAEMKPGVPNACAQIETMRVLALRPRTQVQLGAAVLARVAGQPSEQGLAITLRARGFVGNQIVHVQKPSPSEGFRNALTGERLPGGV